MSFPTVLLVALISAPAALAVETQPGSTQGGPSGRDPLSGASETTVPDPDEPLYVSRTRIDRIGRILVPVMINGRGPFRFVVDTGATHSVMSSRLVRQLGLVACAGCQVLLSGVTGSAVVSTVQVEQFQAGALLIENRFMPVVDSVLSGADGVLGVQGLEDKRIVVDFSRDQIQILESRGAPSRRELLAVPVKLGFNRLLLANALVGSVRVKAIIDTGAERTLGNDALRQALKIGTDPRNLPPSIGVQGVTTDIQWGDVVTAPRIKLGDMNITQVKVTFGDLHVFKVWGFGQEPVLLIGMDVLGTLDMIIIDYRRQEVQFKPRGVPLRMQILR